MISKVSLRAVAVAVAGLAPVHAQLDRSGRVDTQGFNALTAFFGNAQGNYIASRALIVIGTGPVPPAMQAQADEVVKEQMEEAAHHKKMSVAEQFEDTIGGVPQDPPNVPDGLTSAAGCIPHDCPAGHAAVVFARDASVAAAILTYYGPRQEPRAVLFVANDVHANQKSQRLLADRATNQIYSGATLTPDEIHVQALPVEKRWTRSALR